MVSLNILSPKENLLILICKRKGLIAYWENVSAITHKFGMNISIKKKEKTDKKVH